MKTCFMKERARQGQGGTAVTVIYVDTLFLLNALAGITGYVFTVNFVTAAIVGVLGMPGILLLILSSFLL